MLEKEQTTSNASEKFSTPFLFEVGIGKLLALGGFSAILCSSGPLLPLASVPLASAWLLAGRVKGSVSFVFAMTLLSSLIGFKYLGIWTAFFMAIVSVLAFSISEGVRRKFNPVVIWQILTASFCLLVTISLVITWISLPENWQQLAIEHLAKEFQTFRDQNVQLVNANSEEARNLLAFLERPDLIFEWMKKYLVGSMYAFVQVFVFIPLTVVLRSASLWRIKWNYPFSLKDLMNYRANFLWVYPLIIALAGAILGEELSNLVPIISLNVLVALSGIFFVQGSGVFAYFLRRLKVPGFLMMMTWIFVILLFWQLVPIIGILDLWIDWRKINRLESSINKKTMNKD